MGPKINGSTSGSIEIDVPAVAGTDTAITIPATTGGEFIVSDSSGNIDLGPLDINGSASDDSVNIDGSGRLLVGTDTSIVGKQSQQRTLQVAKAQASTSQGVGIYHFNSAGQSPNLELGLSKNNTLGSHTAVSSGDNCGSIIWSGSAGSEFEQLALIAGISDATPSSTSMPGRLGFFTTPSGSVNPIERMRITDDGALMAQANKTSTDYNGNDPHHQLMQASNNYVLQCYNSNASVTAELVRISSTAVQASGRSLFKAWSGNGGAPSDTEFHLRMDGNGYADGSWNGGGADYAEFFEWSDGNTDSEDRRGISVVLDGDKIREAVAGEEPIGVISANPSCVGDSADLKWSGKYLRDDFGSYQKEPYTFVEWTNEDGDVEKYASDFVPAGITVPDDAVTKTVDDDGTPLLRRVLNPAYDPDVTYVPREQRAEWDPVGLMGKLRIRKGQVTGARWIKMRDISDTVEEWLVR